MVVLAVAVSVPVVDVIEIDEDVAASSPTVVEEAAVEVAEVASVVLESCCRGSGRTTPAKTALRHKYRTKKAHSRWDAGGALILSWCMRGQTSPMASHHNWRSRSHYSAKYDRDVMKLLGCDETSCWKSP